MMSAISSDHSAVGPVRGTILVFVDRLSFDAMSSCKTRRRDSFSATMSVVTVVRGHDIPDVPLYTPLSGTRGPATTWLRSDTHHGSSSHNSRPDEPTPQVGWSRVKRLGTRVKSSRSQVKFLWSQSGFPSSSERFPIPPKAVSPQSLHPPFGARAHVTRIPPSQSRLTHSQPGLA